MMQMKQKLLLANSVKRNVTQAFLEKQKIDIVHKLLADDNDEDDKDKLRVLGSGEGVTLLLNIYQDYVSPDDYVLFPKFMRQVDMLLFQARGNRGFTKEDRDQKEQEASALADSRKKKKVKKKTKLDHPKQTNDTNTNNTVTASDDLDQKIGNFFEDFLRKTAIV